MTAILNSIAFDESTMETLLKISASNGTEELEGTKNIIDLLYDLGDNAPQLSGVPAGEYTLVVKADLGMCREASLYLCDIGKNRSYTLHAINLEKIAQSMITHRESYIELEMVYEKSAQDSAAQKKYEDDSCAISALRTDDLKVALSPYIAPDHPRFFHELLQGLQLLVQDYAQNLLELTPQPQFMNNDVDGDAPPARTLQ